MKKTLLACILVLAFGATAVMAETIYLKDGTVVHGRIVRVNETTVMVEIGDSWKQIDRSTIELIRPDDAKPYPPASAAGQPPQAAGFEPDRRNGPGVYLGLQVLYNSIGGDYGDAVREQVDPGLGIGLVAGYRFDRNLALEMDLAGSSHGTSGTSLAFGEFSLNLKYNVRSEGDEVSPFLFVGIGSFAIGDEDLMLGGYGYNLGAGIDFPVSAQNAIGIAVMRKFIRYDEIVESSFPTTIDGTINGDTTSVRIDLTHHF